VGRGGEKVGRARKEMNVKRKKKKKLNRSWSE